MQTLEDLMEKHSELGKKISNNPINLNDLEKFLLLKNRLVVFDTVNAAEYYTYYGKKQPWNAKEYSVSIGAKLLNHCTCEVSQKAQSEDQIVYELRNRLKAKLKVNIGEQSPYGNDSGACCEVHASNFLLSKGGCLKDVEFTPARRVRTNQLKERCDNCIQVFGLEKR